MGVFDYFRAQFNYDSPSAFLGNTRTTILGTDFLGNLGHAANTEPGTFPFPALDFAKANDEIPIASPGQGPTVATYDCATGKCSDGSAPNNSNFITKALACQGNVEAYKRAMCRTTMQGIDQASDAVRDRVLGAFGISDAAMQHYMKQAAFILLALVLVYAAMRSIK